MWRTPNGERVLQGAEWELFREGLDVSWDWVEESMDDPALFPFDVKAFDSLQPNQRLALLAVVSSALKDETVPAPELTAHIEATVAAVFGCITTQVAMEVDAASEGQPCDDPTITRKLILAAYHQAAEQDAAEDPDAFPERDDAHAHGAPVLEDGAEEDDDIPWQAPDPDSGEMEEWEYLIDYLANRILWEDGDYEMGDQFMDADPSESRAKMAMLRIADDYYTAIAPDPTDQELGVFRQQLAKLCGRLES